MTERDTGWTGAARGADEESAPQRPVIKDKRRIDPETGAVRGADGVPASETTPNEEEAVMAAPDETGPVEEGSIVDESTATSTGATAAATTDGATTAGAPDGEGDVAAYSSSGENPAAQPAANPAEPSGAEATPESPAEESSPDATLAEDLRRDLQRLNAEYVNYKRRVDRDRELHRDLAVSGVVEALLPVLDDIHLARQHGDLEEGPFAAIADKLEATLKRYGVERYGEAGEAFDPNVHEALMHTEAELPEGTETTTVVQVLQPGYKMNDRVVRPARVAVADPS
ncbi:MAG TPA: nucleotide exchange factor GrpE [Segeticoccus sp.]|uniref:nucleotide exchange factor GrpE n=1 Tax=Segeticoccus sp. TaxID=2706531 RepID=UPI002D7E9F90|nr:nucleotide exchange factor GrpE [Segeticoccus sp.]HET8600003.1 nucleotide exchange factor GrpE [Segeticoccus sp.]